MLQGLKSSLNGISLFTEAVGGISPNKTKKGPEHLSKLNKKLKDLLLHIYARELSLISYQ